ncbi:uncharacterized protein BJ212DRAFT_1302948 [Suillus subaureus]|uniref:Uncharacterized protein n=1 Tax=Suillus subaureus TaxID=48587 RepID=A0A9P7E211_9AGAM|nr:uncharacterized protein BJ212DRAFT_1302948 [Suillus subaureus]KAG1808690.1 hypothetical protein BJ212DRAFT_1302948 [Suillus subaureus]
MQGLLHFSILFDADWHGMGIHVIWKEDTGVELKFTLQVVPNPVRTSARKRRDWNLQSLFGRFIARSCPVTSFSSITDVLPEEKDHQITPENLTRVDGLTIYDLSSLLPLLILVTLLSVKRTIRGATQTRGVLSVSAANNSPQEISAGYLEIIPALLTL